MPSPEGSESVRDTEYIYRRIPVATGWYDPSVSTKPSDRAFRPRRDDPSDLSVQRADYTPIEQAAQGKSRRGYYIAILRVGDLRARGIDVVARPLPDDPGHAEIQGLNATNRDKSQYREWQVILARELTLRVEGPFPPQPQD